LYSWLPVTVPRNPIALPVGTISMHATVNVTGAVAALSAARQPPKHCHTGSLVAVTSPFASTVR